MDNTTRPTHSASTTGLLHRPVLHGHHHASAPTLSSSSRTRSATSSHSESSGEEFFNVPHTSWTLDNRLPLDYFKVDVLKMIHQLRIQGWKRVRMEDVRFVDIERLSGALTNAVYKVSLSPLLVERSKSAGAELKNHHSHFKSPPALLLRIYGPNVSLLFDRESELAILERLASKKIGPRLLGTFLNGRIEEFYKARSLTNKDIRDANISKMIAKRMRELHDNVSLLPEEKVQGPSVWIRTDKWIKETENIIKGWYADDRFTKSQVDERVRGIFHSDFNTFVKAVHRYKEWVKQAEGPNHDPELVFAHNDTQYGNLLMLIPTPRTASMFSDTQNKHRQLVVIDFEYSGANTRGYDIANHFCEWMGDYHDANEPQRVHESMYPSKEEQRRFISAYVTHGGESLDNQTQEEIDRKVDKLEKEARIWRPAVSIFWLLWGVIQAPPITEGDQLVQEQNILDRCCGNYRIISEEEEKDKLQNDSARSSLEQAVQEEEENNDEFDYLDYSSDKAAIFWSDMEQIGLAKENQDFNTGSKHKVINS